MTTPLRQRLSLLVGWLADRRVPVFLRPAVYGTYCLLSGADVSEARLPYRAYGSLGAFFVRRLRPDARAIDEDPGVLVSPCDGRLQARDAVRDGRLLQAKGRAYALAELLAGAADDLELEGAQAWTIYLSPRDYHRVHAPLEARLARVVWVPGARRSVAPGVLARRERVLATNERAVLRLEDPHGPCFLVMVGALNVGRIRVVGVPNGMSPAREAPPRFERGAELARFEMGSTVVLVFPPGRVRPLPELEPGARLTLGQRIARLAP